MSGSLLRFLAPMIGVLLFATAWLVHRERLDIFLGIRTDSLGYYQFLPAAFLAGDLRGLPWVHVLEDGSRLSLFTIGVALLQLPFFLLGHVCAWIAGAARDGYSAPYAVAQLLGTATYVALGAHAILRLLLRSTDRVAALLAVLLLVFATNLFYYAVHEPGMSHAYAFAMTAFVLLITEEQRTYWTTRGHILLCTVGALLILVRPLHAVFFLVPLLWRTRNTEEIMERVRWWWRTPWATGAGIAIGALFFLPQLLYWKMITGKWVLFTYGTKGEGFDWNAPHLWDVLFSHQNGWLIYTPLMIFAWSALVVHGRTQGSGARTALVLWGISWYVYACWWAWWLGAAYGFRGFVDHLSLFALPLALLLGRVIHAQTPIRVGSLVLAAFLTFLNVRMSALYAAPWDGPDWTWARLAAIWREALFL
jgi:hypothetical protein